MYEVTMAAAPYPPQQDKLVVYFPVFSPSFFLSLHLFGVPPFPLPPSLFPLATVSSVFSVKIHVVLTPVADSVPGGGSTFCEEAAGGTRQKGDGSE